ncbi:hypothetical protein Acr_10g0008450 [Actinidia rufa]|uniref:Uncharacterized protein n=1 Tax=Actinidia rufa TaxID=165716 RepID=A0A7J0F9T4_9ERIC|nr:hypothetical protein Acr_10g0008450 [Actinidia rufa]
MDTIDSISTTVSYSYGTTSTWQSPYITPLSPATTSFLTCPMIAPRSPHRFMSYDIILHAGRFLSGLTTADFYLNSLASSMGMTVTMAPHRITKAPAKGILHEAIIDNPPVLSPAWKAKEKSPEISKSRSSNKTQESATKEARKQGRLPCPNDYFDRHHSEESTEQKFKDLSPRINTINTGVNALVTVDALIRHAESQFTERVMMVRVSSKFKLLPKLGVYEGKKDPIDHLDSYKNLMMLQGASDEVICKAFLTALRGSTSS